MSRTWIAAAAAAAIFGMPAVATAQGNVENGADVFRKCRACHLVGEGAKDTVGPQLNNMMGRKAGTSETYKTYSDNMKELGTKDLVWSDANLDKYLENPKAVVPQGKMAFPGLKEKSDRDDVIAYLKTFSK
jgi:cytochrome c